MKYSTVATCILKSDDKSWPGYKSYYVLQRMSRHVIFKCYGLHITGNRYPRVTVIT